MNDNEIIKALEENKNNDEFGEFAKRYISNALDLINRQKAEIERLQAENKKQKAILEEINDEINPLPFETDFDIAMKKAKYEAIKEFAEKVKTDLDKRVSKSIRNQNPHWFIAKRIVRETVIEMTESNE